MTTGRIRCELSLPRPEGERTEAPHTERSVRSDDND